MNMQKSNKNLYVERKNVLNRNVSLNSQNTRHKSSNSSKLKSKERDNSFSWSKKMKSENSKFKNCESISSFKNSWNSIDVLVRRSMRGSEGFSMKKRQKSSRISNRLLKDWTLVMAKKRLWERNLTLWLMSSELSKVKLMSWSGNLKAKEPKNAYPNAKSMRSTFRLAKRSCKLVRNHPVFSGFVMRFLRKTPKYQLLIASTNKSSTLITTHW